MPYNDRTLEWIAPNDGRYFDREEAQPIPTECPGCGTGYANDQQMCFITGCEFDEAE